MILACRLAAPKWLPSKNDFQSMIGLFSVIWLTLWMENVEQVNGKVFAGQTLEWVFCASIWLAVASICSEAMGLGRKRTPSAA